MKKNIHSLTNSAIAEAIEATEELRKRRPKLPFSDWIESVFNCAIAVAATTFILALMLAAFGANHFRIIGIVATLVIQLAGLSILFTIGISAFSILFRGHRHLIARMSYEQVTAHMLADKLWTKQPNESVWQQVQAVMDQDHAEHKQRQTAFLALAGLAIVLLFGTPSTNCPVNTPGDILGFLFSLRLPPKFQFDACNLRILSGSVIFGMVLGAALQQRWIVTLHKARYLVRLTLAKAE